MRRPANLALDLVDEPFDALRRSVGLLLLNPDEGRLVLLVGEPEVERTVDDQCRPDERDKQERVFAQQTPARV
jgi:hypothetical protein